MDPRHQNPAYASSNNASQGSGNYQFHGAQADPFQAFVNQDDASGYDSPWSNQGFSNPQPGIGGFDADQQSWQSNIYQNSNPLPLPNYGAPPREFDQTYSSRPPASFNYSDFGQDQNSTYPTPGFDNSLGYGNIPINDRFGIPGAGHYGQPNETISPQALQTYPQGLQNPVQQQRQSQHQPYSSSLNDRGVKADKLDGDAAVNQPLSHQDWDSLSASKTASIYRGGLHIKPTDAFAKATNSTRLDGFIFVGNGPIRLSTLQTPVQRHKRRKSRNEVSRLLQLERGDDRPHPDRGPIIKRLKTAATKLAGPAPPQTHSGSNTNSESESSDSESDEDSEYSDSDLEIEAEEPSPVPLTRPSDPSKAIEYDIIKTVWAKKKAVLSGTVIRTALTECWNIFFSVRDSWKKKCSSLQAAIEKKDAANKNAFERRVLEQRRLLESCIRLTLKHGHPSIVEKLGENPKLLVVFYMFLADRIKEADYTGSFVNSILELMTRCTSIDASLLEQTKMDKVLPRFVKRGDEQGKTLAQKILDNAAKAKSQKGSNIEASSGTSSAVNGASSDKQSRAGSTEAHKPRANATKESIVDVGGKPPKTPLTGKSSASNGESDTKVKTAPAVAKPTGFFAGLQSASKKPGTSSKTKDGKPTSSLNDSKSGGTDPAPRNTFSFSATMAKIQKQKEAPAPKPEDSRKPETPEEEQKRLRKEQRRKLRVSFKGDDDLVEIREFVHDPEEDMGHEDSQTRDVGDSRGEGQMLKMHKDLELMDEDEDYEPPEEIEPMPDWTIPQATDFSEIESMEREKNFITRGGLVEPESEERRVQEQRESSTLMTVYTSLSDIPLSSREPPLEDSQMRVEENKFGDPPPSTKARESEYRARFSNPQTQAAAQPVPDLAAILARINGQNKPQQQNQVQPQQPSSAPALAGLQAVLAQFSNNGSNQQQGPQYHMGQQPPVAPNFAAAYANPTQPNTTQQPYQPQSNLPPAQPGQVDLQAILAQINGGPQLAPPAAQTQSFGFAQNPNTLSVDNDRKRQFDSNDQDDYGKGKKMRGEAGKEKKPFYGVKTQPCRFFQEGKCRKGDECTFIHE